MMFGWRRGRLSPAGHFRSLSSAYLIVRFVLHCAPPVSFANPLLPLLHNLLGTMAPSTGGGRASRVGLGISKATLFILISIGTIAAVAVRTRSKKRRRSMSYALGPDGKHVDIGCK